MYQPAVTPGYRAELLVVKRRLTEFFFTLQPSSSNTSCENACAICNLNPIRWMWDRLAVKNRWIHAIGKKVPSVKFGTDATAAHWWRCLIHQQQSSDSSSLERRMSMKLSMRRRAPAAERRLGLSGGSCGAPPSKSRLPNSFIRIRFWKGQDP